MTRSTDAWAWPAVSALRSVRAASSMVAPHFIQGLSAHEECQIAFAFPILDPSFTDQPVLAIYGSHGRKPERRYPPAAGSRRAAVSPLSILQESPRPDVRASARLPLRPRSVVNRDVQRHAWVAHATLRLRQELPD